MAAGLDERRSYNIWTLFTFTGLSEEKVIIFGETSTVGNGNYNKVFTFAPIEKNPWQCFYDYKRGKT